MKKINAMVLAGGELPEDLQKYSEGYNNRALIKIGGRFMIEYVVDALMGAERIDRIVIVGLIDPMEKLFEGKAQVIQAKEKLMENLGLGVKALDSDDIILIATADIPLITPGIVDRFIEECEKYPAEAYYSAINKKLFEEKYPETVRTYMKMKEGVYSGGNLVMTLPAAVWKAWEATDKIMVARKSPIKLLKIVGVGFILKYLFKMMAIEHSEQAVLRISGVKGKVVPVADPEIGIDVDKESDYLLVKKLMEG